MPSNAYFLATFRFDTAENEPAKNVQNCVLLIQKFRRNSAHVLGAVRGGRLRRVDRADGVRRRRLRRLRVVAAVSGKQRCVLSAFPLPGQFGQLGLGG